MLAVQENFVLVLWFLIVDNWRARWRNYSYMIFAGSLRLFTQQPLSHFSFFLDGNVVCINLEPACVFLISQ